MQRTESIIRKTFDPYVKPLLAKEMDLRRVVELDTTMAGEFNSAMLTCFCSNTDWRCSHGPCKDVG